MLKITSTVSLESIPHDTKIARYFTREKIDRLTKERTIWFANVKSFKDKHERQIPDAFFKDWPRDSVNSYRTISTKIDEKISAFVSCWTMFDGENYALWKMYDPESTGVCIVTTVGELLQQVNRSDLVLCYVEYINPNKVEKRIDLPWIIYEPGSVPHAMRVKEKFKILPYKYENEVRGIIYKIGEDSGIALHIDVVAFVKEIYLNPFMNKDASLLLKTELEKVFDPAIFKESIINEK
ncbi:MAG: DUF2971 domain-containing protein [Syntrophomonadaceae bacterium]|nr:DUF2971 domain-containing protein [Syntrophomonadaceae bacterium]